MLYLGLISVILFGAYIGSRREREGMEDSSETDTDFADRFIQNNKNVFEQIKKAIEKLGIKDQIVIRNLVKKIEKATQKKPNLNPKKETTTNRSVMNSPTNQRVSQVSNNNQDVPDYELRDEMGETRHDKVINSTVEDNSSTDTMGKAAKRMPKNAKAIPKVAKAIEEECPPHSKTPTQPRNYCPALLLSTLQRGPCTNDFSTARTFDGDAPSGWSAGCKNSWQKLKEFAPQCIGYDFPTAEEVNQHNNAGKIISSNCFFK